MLTTKDGGPEGFPWLVMDGARAVAAAPDEASAERVAHVLGAWSGGAGAPRTLVQAGARVPYGATRPAAPEASPAAPAGAWGGRAAPLPGHVYELSGLAREGVARDVTGQEPRPVIVVRERSDGPPVAVIPADGPLPETRGVPHDSEVPARLDAEAWMVGEARVARRASGGYAVSFPARPPVHVRNELKAGGFRWYPEASEWRGVRLPVRLLPHRAGGAL